MRAALPSAAGPLLVAALSVPSVAQDPEVSDHRALERRTAEIQAEAAPSVVRVTVTTRAIPVPRLAFPGLVISCAPEETARVEGAGFFMAERGVLVTTNDLVRNAAAIEVRFADGSVRDASLLGSDAPFRLAVLRTSQPGDVASLRHAERVEASPSAVGWFLGPSQTGARGSIAVEAQVATVRPAPEQGDAYDRYLFAPISIQRGTAGGPLLGGDGTVLGMAVGALVARAEAPADAAPLRYPHATLFVRSDDLVDAVRQIVTTGRVERAMLGAMMDGDTNRVETPLAGGPAEAAGLAEGDAIVKVGCMPVANYADISRALLRRRAGDPVKVTVDRAGERLTRVVKLAPLEPPADPVTAPVPGATLEVSAGDDGEPIVRVLKLEPHPGTATYGLTEGDRLVSIDGRPVWQFLRRHRFRAAPAPAALTVVRGDATLTLGLQAQ